MNGKLLIFSMALLVVVSIVWAAPGQRMIVGNFSQQQKGRLPVAWEPMTFGSIKKHTDYRLVPDTEGVVLKAESHAAASGLTYKVRFNPKDYPFISWRWKVDKALQHTDVTSKSGDDYAARIYVSFDYDVNRLPARDKTRINLFYLIKGFYPPLATLNYIWAGPTPIGKIVPSPYTNRVRMVVLKNRGSRIQQWYSEERNILEDYRTAFGEEPRDVISVAVMTDTDNAGEKTTSYYGDIVVSKQSTRATRAQ